MIALVINYPQTPRVEIRLFRDKDRQLAERQREILEIAPYRNVFILEARKLETLMQTHAVWFDKLTSSDPHMADYPAYRPDD